MERLLAVLMQMLLVMLTEMLMAAVDVLVRAGGASMYSGAIY